LANSGANVLGLEWTVSTGNIKSKLTNNNKKIALQGNLDPMVLMGSHEIIQEKVKKKY
jgi:uroporphyrinogen decarboxylase